MSDLNFTEIEDNASIALLYVLSIFYEYRNEDRFQYFLPYTLEDKFHPLLKILGLQDWREFLNQWKDFIFEITESGYRWILTDNEWIKDITSIIKNPGNIRSIIDYCLYQTSRENDLNFIPKNNIMTNYTTNVTRNHILKAFEQIGLNNVGDVVDINIFYKQMHTLFKDSPPIYIINNILKDDAIYEDWRLLFVKIINDKIMTYSNYDKYDEKMKLFHFYNEGSSNLSKFSKNCSDALFQIDYLFNILNYRNVDLYNNIIDGICGGSVLLKRALTNYILSTICYYHLPGERILFHNDKVSSDGFLRRLISLKNEKSYFYMSFSDILSEYRKYHSNATSKGLKKLLKSNPQSCHYNGKIAIQLPESIIIENKGISLKNVLKYCELVDSNYHYILKHLPIHISDVEAFFSKEEIDYNISLYRNIFYPKNLVFNKVEKTVSIKLHENMSEVLNGDSFTYFYNPKYIFSREEAQKYLWDDV